MRDDFYLEVIGTLPKIFLNLPLTYRNHIGSTVSEILSYRQRDSSFIYGLALILLKKLLFSAECRVDNDCPLDKACQQENCINPCTTAAQPCGRGAECRVDYHQPRCICPPGLQGNPLVACVSVECNVDSDCRDDHKCEILSQKCVPVCTQGTCAPDATCIGRNHQPECSCNIGFRGSGYVACIKRELLMLVYLSFYISLYLSI